MSKWSAEQAGSEWFLLYDGDYRAATSFKQLAETMVIVMNEHEAFAAATSTMGPDSAWQQGKAQILEFKRN